MLLVITIVYYKYYILYKLSLLLLYLNYHNILQSFHIYNTQLLIFIKQLPLTVNIKMLGKNICILYKCILIYYVSIITYLYIIYLFYNIVLVHNLVISIFSTSSFVTKYGEVNVEETLITMITMMNIITLLHIYQQRNIIKFNKIYLCIIEHRYTKIDITTRKITLQF